MRIKICGITRLEDAILAYNLGAWAIGLIFVPSSPRLLSLEKAKEISQELERYCPDLLRIGVFLDQPEDYISNIIELCKLDGVQFHGSESPEFVERFDSKIKIKAFVLDKKMSLESLMDKIGSYKNCIPLLDLPKDTNVSQDVLIEMSSGLKALGIDFIVAGRIDASNIGNFLKIKPFAIDISRGVEASPGIKDRLKLEELFSLIKGDDMNV